MPDDDGSGNGQDPGPIETGPVQNLAATDPGPIETEFVMQSRRPAEDPMADRDLHLDEVGGQQDDGPHDRAEDGTAE